MYSLRFSKNQLLNQEKSLFLLVELQPTEDPNTGYRAQIIISKNDTNWSIENLRAEKYWGDMVFKNLTEDEIQKKIVSPLKLIIKNNEFGFRNKIEDMFDYPIMSR